MKPENVMRYLQDNPQFFTNYADKLADIDISRPKNGKVISFGDRQVSTLRKQNCGLRQKILELINFGEENDAIGEKMHRLSVALLKSLSLETLLHEIYFHLREDFAVPNIAIRLWGVFHKDSSQDEFIASSGDVHAVAENLSQPYCGTHITDEIKYWLDKDVSHLNSFSMIPLRVTETIGLLVLGSPELQRFYPDMGTLHLKRLGDLVSTALMRCNN